MWLTFYGMKKNKSQAIYANRIFCCSLWLIEVDSIFFFLSCCLIKSLRSVGVIKNDPKHWLSSILEFEQMVNKCSVRISIKHTEVNWHNANMVWKLSVYGNSSLAHMTRFTVNQISHIPSDILGTMTKNQTHKILIECPKAHVQTNLNTKRLTLCSYISNHCSSKAKQMYVCWIVIAALCVNDFMYKKIRCVFSCSWNEICLCVVAVVVVFSFAQTALHIFLCVYNEFSLGNRKKRPP